MTSNTDVLRPARATDAAVLAELVNHAGEGLPLYLWRKMAKPGQSPWQVGIQRAGRHDGAFSFRNATIVEHGGQAAGALIGYAISSAPGPIPRDMPPMFVPLQELENEAPETWYLNVLAVLPEFRGRGLGSRLLQLADETARTLGKTGVSLIVSDANIGARRLYERNAYVEIARRRMVKEDWISDGQEWVLLRNLSSVPAPTLGSPCVTLWTKCRSHKEH